jgi:hypothetical protein
LWVDIETGGFLTMKRAQSRPVCACAFQGNVGANDINDVIGRANLLQKCLVDETAHEGEANPGGGGLSILRY